MGTASWEGAQQEKAWTVYLRGMLGLDPWKKSVFFFFWGGSLMRFVFFVVLVLLFLPFLFCLFFLFILFPCFLMYELNLKAGRPTPTTQQAGFVCAQVNLTITFHSYLQCCRWVSDLRNWAGIVVLTNERFILRRRTISGRSGVKKKS